MLFSKFQLGVAVAVLLGIVGGLIGSVRENAGLRRETVRQAAASAARTAELQQQVAAETQRVTAAEANVTALLKSAKTVEAMRSAARSAAPAPTDTQEVLKATLSHATQLIREGKFQEALDEDLKCYRELEAKRPGSSECQSLMGAIKNLGRSYPPAMVALGELRDAAVSQRQASPERRELVFEIALLNERLGEGGRTVALYDSLPPDDPGRQSLSMIANSSFVAARRYADALIGNPLGKMLGMLESGARLLATQPNTHSVELRKTVIDGTVTNIEVLTGAGKPEDARMLAEKLLAFDDSESTRAAIKEHVERASQPPVR